MVSAEQGRAAEAVRRLSRSIGAKLFFAVFVVLLFSLGLLGYIMVRVQRSHLEQSRLSSAVGVSEVIRESTSYYMLRNDREALRHIVEAIGSESEVLRLRVADANGHVAFSTNREEVGRSVNWFIPAQQHVRTYDSGQGRVLGITTPIRNSAACASGGCHAHPISQQVLGVLDVDVSLARADQHLREATWQFTLTSVLVVLITLATIGALVLRFVHRPVKVLREGTQRLGRGELGVQIKVDSDDELGMLAQSFNQMSSQLDEAHAQITAWTATLEERVEKKTAELRQAQQQMIQAEKLTSLGKLAAVVAHEVNNPLFSILTYAKLMRKWVEQGETMTSRATDMRESLQMIESESRRCGEIISNLLTFARVRPMNVSLVDLNHLVRLCIKLVEHKLELGNIVPVLNLDPELPPIRGDSGQIEQLLLALIMNAIDAMPHEGTLWITTEKAGGGLVVTIEDDGIGIPASLLPRLFDPFVTTKKEGKGVGLGLAISRSIVEQHQGTISVHSVEGQGTRFTITLPLSVPAAEIGEQEMLAHV